MKIGLLPASDLNKLAEFNRRVFPGNERDFSEYFNYKFLKNPVYPDMSAGGSSLPGLMTATDDDGKIIGQINLMPFRFYYKGNPELGHWGMDYIVDENYRNESAGMLLARKALKFPNHFGAGLSPISLDIHLAFKETIIGHLKKNILLNWKRLPFLIFKRKKIKIAEFPIQVRTRKMTFTKLDNAVVSFSDKPWNTHLLEPDRSESFMKWRFCNTVSNYAIYVSSPASDTTGRPVFFVVRSGRWRERSFLVLCDYRFDTTQEDGMLELLAAVKIIMRKMKFSGILSMSSLKTVDHAFKSGNFRVFGKQRAIVSNRVLDEKDRSQIAERDFIFMTMADTDTDFNFTESNDFTFESNS